MTKICALILIFLSTSPLQAEGFVSVCNRSPEVRAALESKLNLKCEQIDERALKSIGELEIQFTQPFKLTARDLSGLSEIWSLYIAGTGSYPELSIETGALDIPSGFSLNIRQAWIPSLKANSLKSQRLYSITFYHSRIDKIEAGAFRGLNNVKEISFMSVDIRKIHKFVFTDIPKVRQMRFVICSNLVEIEDESFIDLPSLESISVSKSPLTATRKAAFRGAFSVLGLPENFDVDSPNDEWAQP